jgi:hypothetical protein
LIAAAPEMLAALEAAEWTLLGFELRLCADALGKVQAAITKAKGDAE